MWFIYGEMDISQDTNPIVIHLLSGGYRLGYQSYCGFSVDISQDANPNVVSLWIDVYQLGYQSYFDFTVDWWTLVWIPTLLL